MINKLMSKIYKIYLGPCQLKKKLIIRLQIIKRKLINLKWKKLKHYKKVKQESAQFILINHLINKMNSKYIEWYINNISNNKAEDILYVNVYFITRKMKI